MGKKKLTLETLLIFLMILFCLFETKSWWLPFFQKIRGISALLLLAFCISYTIYPLFAFLKRKLKKKKWAYGATIFLLIFTIFICIIFSYPILKKEILYFTEMILEFFHQLLKKEISFGIFTNTVYTFLTEKIQIIEKLFYQNAIDMVTSLVSIFSKITFVTFFSLLFLWKMDQIREKIHWFAKKKRKEQLLLRIDEKMQNYVKSIAIISLIETIEYTILYGLIGHPNYLLLGFLAGITTFIPYIGALFTNLLALLTAIKLSRPTFLLTILILIFVPMFNNYFVDPKVYHKTIQIRPGITILAMLILSFLFSIAGSIMAIPILIILLEIREERNFTTKKIHDTMTLQAKKKT